MKDILNQTVAPELGAVILDWDEGTALESDYEFQKEHYASWLKENELNDLEAYAYWELEGGIWWQHQWNFITDILYEAFEGLFGEEESYYAQFYVAHRYGGSDSELEYVKDKEAMLNYLRPYRDGFQFDSFKIQAATFDGRPALYVTWYSMHTGVRWEKYIVNRSNTVCQCCEYAAETEQEWPFVAKWGRCPNCLSDTLIDFLQGARTDDEKIITGLGDYLTQERVDEIRADLLAATDCDVGGLALAGLYQHRLYDGEVNAHYRDLYQRWAPHPPSASLAALQQGQRR